NTSVIHSTLDIVVDMTLTNFTRSMSPTHFRLTTEFSDCCARSIRFVVFSNSFLRIDYVAPGSGLFNAANDTSYLTDAARIFAVHSFLNVRTIVVDLRNSSIVLSCVCGARCGFVKYGELQRGMFSADVFSLSSIKTDGSTTSTDVVVQMYFATMSIAAPMTTTAVHVSSLYALSVVSVTISDSYVSVVGTGLYIANEARTNTLINMGMLYSASDIVITVYRTVQHVLHESGGCSAAAGCTLSLTGNFSSLNVSLHQVSLHADNIGGRVFPIQFLNGLVTFAVVSTVASLITFASLISTPTFYDSVNVIISNSTVDAAHVTSILPTTSSHSAIVSLVTAVNVFAHIASSSLTMQNVRVVRRNPRFDGDDNDDSSALIPESFTGARSNGTSSLNMLNPFSHFLATIRNDAFFFAIASAILGSGTIAVSNFTVNVSKCIVEYGLRLLPSAIDTPALLVLPNEANFSSFDFSESTLRLPLESEGVGALVGGYYSRSILYETRITMKFITAFSSVLLMIKSNILTAVFGPETLIFLTCFAVTVSAPSNRSELPSLVAIRENGSLHSVVVVSSELQPLFASTPSTLISIDGSHFSEFITVLTPSSSFDITSLPAAAGMVLLHLGCNTWNGHAMRRRHLQQSDPHLRPPLVAYSGDCHKVTSTALSKAATTSVNVAVYVSLLAEGSSSVAATTLQRTSTVLRLWQQCRQRGGGSSASLSYVPDDDDEDPPPFSELSDNPLGVSIPIEVQNLTYAAGAVVGNAVIVLLLGALLHVALHCKERCMIKQNPSFGIRLLFDVIPSTAFPGSLSDTLSTLLLPSVAACAAIMSSPSASVGLLLWGATMAVVWLAFPCFCALAVLWRGRRKRMFVLRGAKLRAAGAPIIAASLSSWVTFVTGSLQEWKVHPSCLHRGTKERHTARFLLQRLEPVFGRFVEGREWYFVVEWSISILSGAILGAAQMVSTDIACAAAQWGGGASISLSALQISMCLLLCPFSQRLEHWMAVLIGFCELLANALAISSKDDAADSVVTAAACIEVTVLIATILLQFVVQRLNERDTTHERAQIERDSSSTKSICCTATPPAGGGSRRTKTSQNRRDGAQSQLFYDLHFNRDAVLAGGKQNVEAHLQALIRLICVRCCECDEN
ncbi:transmembrane protein, putative, partial [Bodo saltans]